jgi:hypothetical protein
MPRHAQRWVASLAEVIEQQQPGDARAWYQLPFIDRYAHAWMWRHGAWEVRPPHAQLGHTEGTDEGHPAVNSGSSRQANALVDGRVRCRAAGREAGRLALLRQWFAPAQVQVVTTFSTSSRPACGRPSATLGRRTDAVQHSSIMEQPWLAYTASASDVG